jgi:hypothetical protein
MVPAMTTVENTGQRLPTAEEENRFWALLEEAWSLVGGSANEVRRQMAQPGPDADPEDDLAVVDGAAHTFTEALDGLCQGMTADELTDLDRVLERKLYDIDRADIQSVTDGSDDGFLYARGFIVAVGREYYAAVSANPGMAIIDCELEAMCYYFAHLHQKKFDSWPETGSGISRETCSNAAGWRSA